MQRDIRLQSKKKLMLQSEEYNRAVRTIDNPWRFSCWSKYFDFIPLDSFNRPFSLHDNNTPTDQSYLLSATIIGLICNHLCICFGKNDFKKNFRETDAILRSLLPNRRSGRKIGKIDGPSVTDVSSGTCLTIQKCQNDSHNRTAAIQIADTTESLRKLVALDLKFMTGCDQGH